MIRALLAALIIVCPAALGQDRSTVRCEGEWCVIHIEALKMLVAQAKMNCGPTR